ncbi:MAG: hypothetical protein QXF70_03390 [Candidatus Bilamarchaeaceae archaeon]
MLIPIFILGLIAGFFVGFAITEYYNRYNRYYRLLYFRELEENAKLSKQLEVK